uniref:Reverse transcriptase domain-containing protein n=1 Tax=Macrostomum lignano TaxID=282301 RepID=A0A1I8FCS5_9PLAT
VVAKTTASWPAPACSSAGLLHDSLTVVSLEDDRRRYASLICAFWDCRAAFGHLEPVLAHLIRLVNGLAARTLAVVHGRHTARNSAFTHALRRSFSFVTLPSLDEPGLRCQLYLESAQVALLNQCYATAADPASPAWSTACALHRLRLVTSQRLPCQLANGLAEIGSAAIDCVQAAGVYRAGAGQLMRHLLIELDNLATAPTGQQAQQQHQRRRIARDLRLGLLLRASRSLRLDGARHCRPVWPAVAN